MGYIYDYQELKTKEDAIAQLKEIEAYAHLDGRDFDFGTGLIKNEMSYGSEDAYYEMDSWALESMIDSWEQDRAPKQKRKKRREHKYVRNRKHKDKLWDAVEDHWYPVYIPWNRSTNYSTYPKRIYRGKRSKCLKKQSSKKIRTYEGDLQMKGSKHKKIFDFWWELY